MYSTSANGRRLHEQLAHDGGGVHTLAFSPDGHSLAAYFNGPDRTKSIVAWDLSVTPPRRYAELPGAASLVGFLD